MHTELRTLYLRPFQKNILETYIANLLDLPTLQSQKIQTDPQLKF